MKHTGGLSKGRRLAALAMAVIGATAMIVVATTGDDGASAPAVDARRVETDDAFAVGSPPETYRITYLVEDPSGGNAPQTDRVSVRAPFDSRVETASGAPPGGEVSTLQVSRLDRLRVGGVDDAATVARVPAGAPAALHVAPILDAAIEAGLLERREQRVVGGRRCQVYRSGSTLGSGPLRPITGTDHADSCIDARGLLLEELLVVEGTAILRRTAVEVEVPAALDDEAFDAGRITATVEQGGGATTPTEPGSAPEGPYLDLPAAALPEGFSPMGRWSVIPPQPERFSDPSQSSGIIAGIADVHTNGRGDSLVLYQGDTLGGATPFAAVPHAQPVTSDALGDGELLLSALGSEVRFDLGGGRFVHLIGTIDPDVLVGLTDALVERTGTGLLLLDD